MESIKGKIVCFIHSTHFEESGTIILDDIIEYLISRNVLYKLDYVLINNIGIPLDELKYKQLSSKIQVVNFSDDVTLYELCTIKEIIKFSATNPDYKLLYLHTKGVTHINKASYKFKTSWRYYMLYSLVDNFDNCIHILNDDYDTVGCQYLESDSVFPRHYSGNYWWAKTSYLQKLPLTLFNTYMDSELQILSQHPKYFNIHHIDGVTGNVYPLSYYSENVDMSFKNYITNSKITYCSIIEQNANPTNQLISCINNCIRKCTYTTPQTEQIIIVDTYNAPASVDLLESIVHLPTLNKYLEKYNILIVDKRQLHKNITSIQFGVKGMNTIDVTDVVFKHFFNNNIIQINNMFIFNELCSDPLPNVKKYLYIKYVFYIGEEKPVEITEFYREKNPVYIDFSSTQKIQSHYNYNVDTPDLDLIRLIGFFHDK